MDLRELYQEVIFDHNRHPRNFGALANADRVADGYNPLCGDKVRVYLSTDGDTVRDAHFDGQGCAISTASASLMTEAVKGKSLEEVQALTEKFLAMTTGGGNRAERDLGKLEVLAGVKEFPARVKCATLAWHALTAAIKGRHETVSTEDPSSPDVAASTTL
jgi:nitrogen fixation protein NifU and related proteins